MTVQGTPTSVRKSRAAAGSLSMPPMQRQVAVIAPTRDIALRKPFAPPPRPLQKPKLL